jgi:hypothetical protein
MVVSVKQVLAHRTRTFGLALISLIVINASLCLGATAQAATPSRMILAQDGYGNIYASSVAGPAHVINATTGNAQIPAESVFPTYALNGTKIFYVHESSAHVLQLRSMNPDGSGVRVVSTLPDQNYPFSMQWSEAAQRFVISDAATQAYTITPQGTGYTRVFTGVAYQADWSPSGQEIAFEGKSGVYLKSATGTNQQLVPTTGSCKTTDNNDVTWDDASTVLVSCTSQTPSPAVSKILSYYMPTKTETVVQQTTDYIYDYLSASPNGLKLAYETLGRISSGYSGETIYELSLLQTSMQKPTPDRVYSVARPTSQDHFPLGPIIAWSPDGSNLTFTGPDYDTPAAHVTNAAGNANHLILSTSSENNPIIALSW